MQGKRCVFEVNPHSVMCDVRVSSLVVRDIHGGQWPAASTRCPLETSSPLGCSAKGWPRAASPLAEQCKRTPFPSLVGLAPRATVAGPLFARLFAAGRGQAFNIVAKIITPCVPPQAACNGITTLLLRGALEALLGWSAWAVWGGHAMGGEL
jgi:hypothetical protein